MENENVVADYVDDLPAHENLAQRSWGFPRITRDFSPSPWKNSSISSAMTRLSYALSGAVPVGNSAAVYKIRE